ncbi:MAG: site-specific integrase [bacterium]|nr:site-specific integrase [bacterium]
MAFLRKRASGNYALSFKWKGKSHIKALGTNDEQAAQAIKKDADEQLARIRRGESAVASRLLAEGISIVDVLFGSPEVTAKLGTATEDNPLTMAELLDGYLARLKSTVGSDQQYNTNLWLKRIRDFFGEDRRVMTLTPDELEQYHKHRAKSVGGTSIKKELGSLKAALTWGIDNKLIPSNPINRWPAIKTQRQKRFEWKSDIDALIASHTFKNSAEREAFLNEMKLRMVLTQKDIKSLIDLAREKEPELVLPLMLVCSTGVRRKELVLIRKQDFDPRRGTIIVGSKKQSKTEDITYRSIVLPSEVARALRQHHKSLPKSERMLFPVFSDTEKNYHNRWVEYETDSKGKPKLDSRGKKIKKTDGRGKPILTKRRLASDRLRSEKAGRMLGRLVKGTEFELMNGWHCLRHSFISICVSKGLTWEQIAEWVGHVSPKTTRLYTHFNLEDSKKRIESLEIRF